MDSIQSKRIRERYRYAYSVEDKEMKKQLKKDMNDWAEKISEEAQKAAEQGGNLKTVYNATRKLSNEEGKDDGKGKEHRWSAAD